MHLMIRNDFKGYPDHATRTNTIMIVIIILIVLAPSLSFPLWAILFAIYPFDLQVTILRDIANREPELTLTERLEAKGFI